MAHLITPIVGGPGFAFVLKDGSTVNPGSQSDKVPQVAIGTIAYGNANTNVIYGGPAGGDVPAGSVCTVNPTTFAITTAAGNHTALETISSGEYGWCRETDPAQP